MRGSGTPAQDYTSYTDTVSHNKQITKSERWWRSAVQESACLERVPFLPWQEKGGGKHMNYTKKDKTLIPKSLPQSEKNQYPLLEFMKGIFVYISPCNFYIESHQHVRWKPCNTKALVYFDSWKWPRHSMECEIRKQRRRSWVIKIIKFLPGDFRALTRALYFQGLRLKLVIEDDWPSGHVWICPGPQPCLHLQQHLNPEGGHNSRHSRHSRGETTGDACAVNWCLKHFYPLRDSFKLGAWGSQKGHDFFLTQPRGPFTVQSKISLLPRIGGLFFLEQSFKVRRCLVSQAVKGADFYQPQEEKIISPLISLLPPGFIPETVLFSEAEA